VAHPCGSGNAVTDRVALERRVSRYPNSMDILHFERFRDHFRGDAGKRVWMSSLLGDFCDLRVFLGVHADVRNDAVVSLVLSRDVHDGRLCKTLQESASRKPDDDQARLDGMHRGAGDRDRGDLAPKRRQVRLQRRRGVAGGGIALQRGDEPARFLPEFVLALLRALVREAEIDLVAL